MQKKRKEEALLKNRGVEAESSMQSPTAFEHEGMTMAAPNGFGGSKGDYMKARLKQIPPDKMPRMLGPYPHVLNQIAYTPPGMEAIDEESRE
jgi:hypothetical protein